MEKCCDVDPWATAETRGKRHDTKKKRVVVFLARLCNPSNALLLGDTPCEKKEWLYIGVVDRWMIYCQYMLNASKLHLAICVWVTGSLNVL